ncbi:hypothetical protein LOC68_26410 [Blastopirellula sp. JC732]|uniref:Uncharacterized protein n=1 Tax=Blastopirellula sediminis TaxID=2894196 RepID=A0A9X1MST8_9BACT|nr:hypothetical protein [Blastopirellula sediminis]MCC9631944.1 hypothetical protein [Blastopirellula sediminis]
MQAPSNVEESVTPVETSGLQLDSPVLRIALKFGAEKEANKTAPPQNDAPAPVAPLTEEEKQAAAKDKADDGPMLKLLPMNEPAAEIGAGVAKQEMKSEPKTVASSVEPAKLPLEIPAEAMKPVEMESIEMKSTEPAPAVEEKPTEEPKPLELAPEAPPKKPLTPEQARLRGKIRRVLDYYYKQPVDVAKENAWATMHAMLPYGVDANVQANGRPVNAIGWLCWNGKCKGYNLFYVENGRLGARQGVGVQGHHGQFLAMLAQSYVTPSYEIRVNNQAYHISDLIEFEKETCRPATELTFKLISLAYYLPVDAEWKSDDGQTWTIERLISEELKQPVIGAACGGTHRLMGLSYAVRKRELSGLPMDGHWGRAQTFLDDYYKYTFRLQNPDGSFSTEWFEGRDAKPDLQRRLQTTGHIAEWLAYSLNDDELSSPQMTKAIDYLATILERNPRMDWSIGPLGHGLHALAIYDQRVFDTPPGHRSAEVATKLP